MASAKQATVLVVEDELFIRLETVDAISAAGFNVIEAGSADEALLMIEQADDVRLLFTDVNMPGAMDGLDLARTVHRRWPEIRLLVTSGQERLTSSDLPDHGRFLGKPYQTRRLVDAIREMMPTC